MNYPSLLHIKEMSEIDYEQLPLAGLKKAEVNFGFHDPTSQLRNPLNETITRAVHGSRSTLAIKMNALTRPRRIFQETLERKKKENLEVFNLEQDMARVKPNQTTLTDFNSKKDDFSPSLGTQSLV